MLSAFKQNIDMLSVIILNIIKLNIIKLSVIMLNIIKLSVLAPYPYLMFCMYIDHKNLCAGNPY